jgi:hypothetical protein
MPAEVRTRKYFTRKALEGSRENPVQIESADHDKVRESIRGLLDNGEFAVFETNGSSLVLVRSGVLASGEEAHEFSVFADGESEHHFVRGFGRG